MPQFKAALLRDAENQPDPITVISIIADLVFFIFGIRKFRKQKQQGGSPIMRALILLIISVGLFLFPIIFKVVANAIFGPGRTRALRARPPRA